LYSVLGFGKNHRKIYSQGTFGIFFALLGGGSLDVLPDTPSLAATQNHRKIYSQGTSGIFFALYDKRFSRF